MKRNILILSIYIIVVCRGIPLSAAGTGEYVSDKNDILWVKAGDIVEANSSILPLKKNVLWEELGPKGETISTRELVIWYGEEADRSYDVIDEEYVEGQRIVLNYAGEADLFYKRNLIDEGLLHTPFNKNADVKILNTGNTESVEGKNCSVYDYVMYCREDDYRYSFEESIGTAIQLYDRVEQKFIRIEGRAWIDDEGVLRQLEKVVSHNRADYKETIVYEYNDGVLYPLNSFLEGRFESIRGDLVVQNNFRAVETMSGYWKATDFSR